MDRTFAKYLEAMARYQKGDHGKDTLKLMREAYSEAQTSPLTAPARAEMARNLVVMIRSTETDWERDPLLTSGDDKSDQEVLPTISELDLTGANALPEMHLDVHVYATKAAERFVYINMRKYREGATLAEGPVLERIRRDGVVLDYHGLRFVLPRQ